MNGLIVHPWWVDCEYGNYIRNMLGAHCQDGDE